MSKKFLIIGPTGQIGWFFADFLLKNTNLIVFGSSRKGENLFNVERFIPLKIDLSDKNSIINAITYCKPDYIVNCAAFTHPANSWECPERTIELNSISIIHILEAIRNIVPKCRFVNIGSILELGTKLNLNVGQTPYAISKITSQNIINCYRNKYDLFAIQPLASQTESYRRDQFFATRKISKGIASIVSALKLNKSFFSINLGNIDAPIHFIHSLDVVEAIWTILNQDCIYAPDCQYIICNEETHTLREFVQIGFKMAGIDGIWINKKSLKISEQNKDTDVFRIKQELVDYPLLVERNEELFRKNDHDIINLDSTNIKNLGWKPKYSFEDIVKEMINYDLQNQL